MNPPMYRGMVRAAWDDRMDARRQVYAFVVQRLEREGRLSPEWDIEAATDMVFALTSWQLWEQLVIDQGWPKERYAHYLRVALRHVLTSSWK